MGTSLLTFDTRGIYCPQADVYIDPWKPVERAVITHAHSDHSRKGMKHYLAHKRTLPAMQQRLGKNINAQAVEYGEPVVINGVRISLHPAGHIWGSSQIRLSYKGQIWVVSGDYKLEADPACTPFEPIPCQHFITESTFGLPIYNWQPGAEVFADLNQWCQTNRDNGIVSVLYGYSLGKSQRLLMGLDQSIGPIFTHPAVEDMNDALRSSGMLLPKTIRITPELTSADFKGGIVITPPSSGGLMGKLEPYATAAASGWMALRNIRKRRDVDQGFVLSDHADWKGLNQAIKATGAEQIFVTHGFTDLYSKYLREVGYDAHIVSTKYDESPPPELAAASKEGNSEKSNQDSKSNPEE